MVHLHVHFHILLLSLPLILRQYADMDGVNNILSGKEIHIAKIFDNLSISGQDISYKGQFGDSEFYLRLYDSTTVSMQPGNINIVYFQNSIYN